MKLLLGSLTLTLLTSSQCPPEPIDPSLGDVTAAVSDVRSVIATAPYSSGNVLACGFTATIKGGEVVEFRMSRDEFGASIPCDKCALLRNGDVIRITRLRDTSKRIAYRWENWLTVP